MALAPVVYCLWQQFLRFDPRGPDLAQPRPLRAVGGPRLDAALFAAAPDRGQGGQPGVRDARRAVGHAGGHQDVSASSTANAPGIPEYRWTSGVETTTGPLGQGVATSVGMAIAGRWLAAHFNRPGFELFDFNVYALCGDGCMMEGVGSEAASLAGHLQLSQPLLDLRQQPHHHRRATPRWPSPRTSPPASSATAGTSLRVGDANDLDMLDRAFGIFQATTDRPTLIIVDSHIGYGAPHKQDTSAAHGEPLGEEEIRLAKRNYGWPEDAKFLVPDGVYEHSARASASAGQEPGRPGSSCSRPTEASTRSSADQIDRMQHRQLPDGWDAGLPSLPRRPKGMASRESLRQGAQRARPECPLADRRRGRSRPRRPRPG